MAYDWSWPGAANVLASVLLLVLGLLFTRARRTHFTVSFATYSVLAAGQKFSGGMWLYVVTEPAAQQAWQTASSLFLLASTPTLVYALAAFTWGRRFTDRPVWMKAGLYAPFVLLVPVAFAGSPAFRTFTVGITVAFLAVLAVFIVAVWRLRRATPSDAVRSQAGFMLAYLVTALSFSVEIRVISLLYGRLAWWELSLAYMVATGILLYGILRTHLFDIDLKVKWTLRRGTVAAVFVAVFFVASELAQQLFAERIGPVAGLVAAGLLVFVLAPLQRLADRVADRAMPNVSADPAYLTIRKSEVYRAAVESALQDGVITDKERDVLATLADQLGIGAGEALGIERAVTARPS